MYGGGGGGFGGGTASFVGPGDSGLADNQAGFGPSIA